MTAPAGASPGALGAHSWQAAFNPNAGWFTSRRKRSMTYESGFQPAPMGWNVATATTNA
jgi:hypothetical protein